MKSFRTFPLAPPFRNIHGHHCGDFYLFNGDSVVRVVIIAMANLLHIQLCVLESSTWIEYRNTVDVGISLGEGPFCKTALCVNRFIYMLSIDGFLVKVRMEDCSASVIPLPNGSYEWRFQQICRSNYSDFLYVHVDGFDIRIWSYLSDTWTPVFRIHVPSIFACHIDIVESLNCIEWDTSRSGWGEFLTMYGVSDGVEHIIMGINGVEHLYLLDSINGTVTLIGSNEELIEISPFVTSWIPSFLTLKEKSAEIEYECLDILGDVFDRSGNVITKDHAYMLTALLSQLSSTEASVRKKTVSCIASLAPCLSDDLLAKATLEAVQLLKKRRQKSEITRTNIQMIGALSCSVGYRFGPHLAEAVPLLISYCTSASENDEELRACSLQALESIMLRCPRDISPYYEGILNLALEYVSYDPNITDSMKEDAHGEVQDEEDDDESASEYKDDKNASWKVRQASAKCLSAIIVSCPQMLFKMYQEACTKLINRFREREENVKMDIFNTFIELLRQTGNVTKGQGDIDESSPRWLLKQEVPKVVKSIDSQLYERSIKTKVGAFSVLKELVVLLPDCLADHLGSLVPWIEMYLNDKSYTSSLKIEALAFTRILMAPHSPSVFHPYIQILCDAIVSAIGDIYYKVTADALRACGELVRVLRPNFEARSINCRPYISPIYEAIWARLANQDQEVNECAISCMSLVIATFGDGLQRELPSCLSLLVDRMSYEITRLTAVKAFAVLANSPLRIDLSCVLDRVVSDLTTFLRKANRALRQATTGTLDSLVVTYGDQIGLPSYETIIAELSILISDIDLHMSVLALELCRTIMVDRSSFQNVGLAVRHKVLPQALILIRSALLQGRALEALQKFFTALVQSANTTFETLLGSLISTAKQSQLGGLAKQALSSIAQCVAVLCLAAGDQKCALTIEMLEGILNDVSSTDTAKQHIALLCLGEIGRRKDLSNHVQIENTVIESFQSPSEEIKSAASYALGNIAVGNLSKYLPFILDQIDNQQKNPYLLLHSLKEAGNCMAVC
ncbi:hypothetical protein CFC21_067885 [Triticum aestivum]|uniref:F-box protein AT5G49610-like beta-propeller domain-containing protein n=2 Tax=Triticum aestivum TaxID=4565 RepID=A0A3B6KQT8_WHEAT|nr:hypothetical protein CFC21_067885 [Triticum aestivum]